MVGPFSVSGRAGIMAVAYDSDSALGDSPVPWWGDEYEESQDGVKVKVMRGHTECVNRCKLCCQDQKIFTVSNDKTARIWDIDTGAVLKTYNCHDMFITSGDISPDNTRFLTCSWDKTLRLWDTETGKMLWQGRHDGIVTCCRFSHNGKMVVSGSDLDHSVSVWHTGEGTLLHHLKDQHKSTITSCSFTPNDERICTTSMDKSTKLWDLESKRTTVKLEGHINVISSCCMDRNERWLCTSSWDKTLQVWDISTGMFRSQGPVSLSKGHEGSVSCCDFTRDGTLLVSGSYDQTVTLWDMETCMHKLSLKGHSDWVTDCSFSEDQKWVISCSKDKTMRFWNIEDTDHIPFVLEQRRAIGLKMVNCEQCGKAFSIAQLEDARELSLCVFCRLAQPNRNVPELDEV
ncbi:WD repeat-containing protein 88-like isoform X3 [Branchiostoma lanceolatum]|uniref:WD repeat-containing protein 88-like isoform X3 n=1 Tax=Branchiostoma lanceolatum TaxID=7740 RepID=UPI003453DA14